MPTLNLAPYKPAPATPGDANQIANGMAAIETIVNALDQNNWAAGKIFDPAKLIQNGAVDSDALVWDAANTKWVPASTLPAAGQKPGSLVKLWDSVDAGVVLPGSFDTGALVIPAAAKHLRIVTYLRETSIVNNFEAVNIRFNNDAGANYYWSRTENLSGVMTLTDSGGAGSHLDLMRHTTSKLDGATFGSGEITISNAFNTASYKPMHALYSANGSGATWATGFGAGRYTSAPAITRIAFLAPATSYAAGSRVTVYAMF